MQLTTMSTDVKSGKREKKGQRMRRKVMGDEAGEERREELELRAELTIEKLLERSSSSGLRHIPFDDVLPEAEKPDEKISLSSKGRKIEANASLKEGETHSFNPTFLNRSTAPPPHLPKAPITNALTGRPNLANSSLTFSTIASSFLKGTSPPNLPFPPSSC